MFLNKSATFLGLLLLGLFFSPQAALAQACPGTTVNGAVVDNADSVSCSGETTIIDFSGSTLSSSVALEASGDGPVALNSDGFISGEMDFSNLENGYVFNNNAGARWVRVADSVLGAGVLNNAGTLDFTVEEAGSRQALSAVGTAFTGTGDSLLEMRVDLNGAGQSSCSAATLVASCMDLRGGATDGRTSIDLTVLFTTLVTGPLTAVTSANPGIVLVDVNGGTGHAGDFVLDPATTNYAPDPVYGAVIDTSEFTAPSGQRTLDVAGGILDYALLYDPTTQQHVLASVPQREAVEYVTFIDQAMSVWHTTSDAVAGRQADVRDGATGKLWFRFVSDRSERDAAPTATIRGNRFTYDQDYRLNTVAAIFGFDASAGDNHVIGFHGGAVSSETDFDDSDSDDEIRGGVVGLYGGWWNGSGLSLDGTFNVNSVTLGHNVPDFEDSDSDIRSIGIRVEAGWRLPLLDETLYVQPLATAAYVKANFDTVELRDNTLDFEDTTSMRAALGARVGGQSAFNVGLFSDLGYWLTARAWEEYVDDGEVRFQYNEGGHLAIEDDRSGSFEEVNFGVNASNQDDTVSGYLSAGATFGDDVDSYNFSIGARLNW